MKSEIHIACAADNSYIQHLSVMLISLFENNKNENICIHLLSSDFSSDHQELIKKICTDYKNAFQFYHLDSAYFSGFHISHHISIATYYRILIPTLVSTEIHKILYLDADMVIQGNIAELYHTPLDNHVVAAVDEPSYNSYESLGIPKEDGYFNAGVLLINLSSWRSLNYTDALRTYILTHATKLQFWDQDALNVCFNGKWLRVEPKYNQQGSFFCLPQQQLVKTYSANSLKEAMNNPVIIHYTGSVKPWHEMDFHPLRHIYIQYLKQASAYLKVTEPTISFKTKCKRTILYFTTPYFCKRIADLLAKKPNHLYEQKVRF